MSNVRVIKNTVAVTLHKDEWRSILFLLQQQGQGRWAGWVSLQADIEEQTGLET